MKKTENSEMTLSIVTHEIRNPVTLLNSYLQLLAESHPEVCDFTYWDLIQEEMTHLKTLLENISACQNAARLHKISLDINQYLQKYTDAVSPLLSQDGHVTFHFSSERHLPRVLADPDRLRQILDNLIRNALEAAPQTTAQEHAAAGASISEPTAPDIPFYIRLHACLQNDSLCISVLDNGRGIPKEALGTLFEPFVTHKPQGTGLGLAICARIAQAHGGTLICASLKDPTEFRLLLPAEIRR